MPKISRSYLLLSLCLMLVSVSSGCATVSVATAGTIAGIAASSISTGAEVYRLGKLDAVEMDTFEDATAAVRLAASDLELKIVEEKKKKGKDDWSFELSDDVKNTLSVRVQQRTDRLAAIRVDVGIFGSEPTAHLVLARIRTHLPSLAQGLRSIPATRSTDERMKEPGTR